MSRGHQLSWRCVWCGGQYYTVEGSRFVYRKERGSLVKRRKCAACIRGETND